MVTNFEEIAFLTDGDLGTLLCQVDNNTLQLALYQCEAFVKERVFKQFSYLGFKFFEMDREALTPPLPDQVVQAQQVVIQILNELVDSGQLDDYHKLKSV